MSLKNYEKITHFLLNKGTLILLLVTLLFTSCQKEAIYQDNENLVSQEQIIQDAKAELKKRMTQKGTFTNLLELRKHPKFREIAKDLTTNARNKQQTTGMERLLESNHFQCAFSHHAINPDDFECGPTFLAEYFAERTKDFTEDDFFFMNNFGFIPIAESFFEDDNDVDFFGPDGAFTTLMNRTSMDLKRFWNGPQVQLSDAHGTVFKEPARVAELLLLTGFGNMDEAGNFIPFTQAEALEMAEFLKIIFGAPIFEDYNHPLFTFFGGFGPGPFGPKMGIGDGLLEGYAELGFRTTSDRFVLAHEYGHALQFSMGLLDLPPTPENVRRIELMADAFAAYYVLHGQGAFIQKVALSRYMKTAFSVGDCNFDAPSHHGTPNQRAKAVEFGGELAKRRGLIDQKYTSEEFVRLFDEAFPQIIAPDVN